MWLHGFLPYGIHGFAGEIQHLFIKKWISSEVDLLPVFLNPEASKLPATNKEWRIL